MTGPVVLETVAALRAWREAQRGDDRRVGLVPTMGALHQGHLSLVGGVRKAAEAVVVSIFVNPTQFAPSEDFSKYPRQFERDLKLLREARVEAVFAPGVTEMYPQGFATTIEPGGPATVGLEDAFRPTHFAGVATVVTKLLTQCAPDAAIFGEKDFQQLAVIRHVARDLDLPVEILGGPTVRDPDGLAMSSRNAYLTPEQRMIATMVHQSLLGARDDLARGKPAAAVISGGMTRLVDTGFKVDYFAIRDATTLAPPEPGADPKSLRILVAATIGATRLIDNIAGG